MTAAAIDRIPSRDQASAAGPHARSGFWRTWLLDTPEVIGGALAALGAYIVAAWVFRYHFGYAVNDAMARTAKAVYMSASRDPHFGAVGFYWPPLPSTLQIPFVLALKPFGRMDFAGPISSALWASLAAVVLARICREHGLGRPSTLIVSVLFLANPITFVYAINGMSESCLYFCLMLAMLGWLRWVRRRGIGDLALIGASLAAGVMVRIESAPVAVVLAVLIGAGRNWRDWISRAAALLLPPAFAIGCWLAIQWLLLKDPLAFLHFDTGQNGVRRSADFLHRFGLPHASHNYLAALPWAGAYVGVFAPALIVLALVAAARPRRHLYAALGIIGSASVFPLVQIYLIVHDTGYGDPRYFTAMMPLGFVAVVWLVSQSRRGTARPLPVLSDQASALEFRDWDPEPAGRPRWPRRLVVATAGPLLVASLVLTASITVSYLLDHNRTNIGGEHSVYEALLGRPVTVLHPVSDVQRLAKFLDPYLAKGQKVILDTNYAYGPILFSRHPSGFIIQEDRDFRPILDSPEGRFQFVVASILPTTGAAPDVIGPLITPPASWKAVGDFGGLRLYRFIGAPP